MLIPQFSLRGLLAVVTGCSLAFLVVSFAVRGSVWALGASVGLLSLVVVALVHGFTFFLLWLFASLTARRGKNTTTHTVPDSTGITRSLIFLGVACLAQQAYAGGAAHTLPTTGKPAPNGMVLNLDTTWPEGFGYRPLTLSVTCTPPLNADRTLSFELRFHDWNAGNTLLTVAVELEVPAGAATATSRVAIPDFAYWQSFSLDTWDDGQHVPSLSSKNLATGSGFRTTSESAPAILCVAPTQPDVTTLGLLFPQPQYTTTTTPGTGNVFPSEWSWRPAATLPEHWLCYQGLDVVLISLDDIRGLAASAPKVLATLQHWTRAGGNLFVYGTGEDHSGLSDIDAKFVGIPQPPGESTATEWQSPSPSQYRGTFSDFVSPNAQNVPVVEVDATGNPAAGVPIESPPADAPFRWRTWQQGTIVGIAAIDPFATQYNGNNWYWMFNTIGSPRWLGAKRTGVSMAEENPDFWMFLIPGVGMAPVDAYRVLITAFVVLIGPVNYLLLRKYHRLHLLLITVPISAVIVTAALLGYALLADGLHTRTRSRSITMLDQRNGDAVTWARLAYYAGLAPSDGLRFSNETAVIPFDHLPTGAGGLRASRSIELTSDQQRLSRGWLPSRTPTQFITVRPTTTTQMLNVITEETGEMIVENQLGVPVRQLLVCGDRGEFGCGETIAVGAKQKITQLKIVGADPAVPTGPPTAPNATAAMRKAFADQVLALPVGFTTEPRYSIFGIQRRYMYRMMGGSTTPVVQATGRLEASLEMAKSAVLQAGLSNDSAALTPRSYIAIVDRPPAVELGLGGTTEIEGFHVIRGRW